MEEIILLIYLITLFIAVVSNMLVAIFTKNQKLATRSKKRFGKLSIVYIISAIVYPKVIGITLRTMETMEVQEASKVFLVFSTCICVYCLVFLLFDCLTYKLKE